MKEFKDIGIIPIKNIDTGNRTLFFKTYFWIFCASSIPLGFACIFFIGIWGLLLLPVISFLATMCVMFISDKISDIIKIIYGATKANISVREQMQSVLKTVKVAKMNKEYSKAFEIVNSILLKDPEFHEALFVKAQILHEGFNNIDAAKKYLRIVIDKAEQGNTIHTWSSSLFDQLCENPT